MSNKEEKATVKGWINIYKRDENDPINDCGYVTGVRIFDTPEMAREYADTRTDGLVLYKTIEVLF